MRHLTRVLLCAGAGVAIVAASCGPAKPPPQTLFSQTYSCTGGAQAFNVPPGVSFLGVDASGAQGGEFTTDAIAPPGGLGGRTVGAVTTIPGEALIVNVGCRGGDTVINGAPGAGGFGGGAGGTGGICENVCRPGAGGGGGSAVQRGVTPLVVAGGGGGSTASMSATVGNGGSGGGETGTTGANGDAGATGGGPGTQSAGGAGGTCCGGGLPIDGAAGSAGSGGQGGVAFSTFRSGGGGGGGFFGGGGGAGGGSGITGAGGGGGGSGFGPPGTTFETGVRAGHGTVTIYWYA